MLSNIERKWLEQVGASCDFMEREARSANGKRNYRRGALRIKIPLFSDQEIKLFNAIKIITSWEWGWRRVDGQRHGTGGALLQVALECMRFGKLPSDSQLLKDLAQIIKLMDEDEKQFIRDNMNTIKEALRTWPENSLKSTEESVWIFDTDVHAPHVEEVKRHLQEQRKINGKKTFVYWREMFHDLASHVIDLFEKIEGAK